MRPASSTITRSPRAKHFLPAVSDVKNRNLMIRFHFRRSSMMSRLGGSIQGSQRFVQQEDGWISHQRACQCDSLALSSGEFASACVFADERCGKRPVSAKHTSSAHREKDVSVRKRHSPRQTCAGKGQDSETRSPPGALRRRNASMPFSESNNTRLPSEISPALVLARPATQSSNVVFPAPEGPNRIVKPGGDSKSTSKTNSESSFPVLLGTSPSGIRGLEMNERVRPLLVQDGCTRRSSRLFYGMDHPGFAIHSHKRLPRAQSREQGE